MDFLSNPHGPGGFLHQIMDGFGGPAPPGPLRRRFLDSYDEYLKAFSMAMLPGKERENVSYGGKIIMPPSSLAHLTNLDVESPWMFCLRNPGNPALTTHAGVLEFIAQEGVVHLPYWMMKSLRLNEGDPIRITGADLPKGRLVKLQAQSVHFLEISDPKAVLEQALRNFSALTQGDFIDISYNSIVFGLLVMETEPGGHGISVLDTDLEVDFAPPVGYVEPGRPELPPAATMASKLNIDVDLASTVYPGQGSSLGAGTTGSQGIIKDGVVWESFKGKGETLSGRKTKGRGISHRKPGEITEFSKIIRSDNHRVMTNSIIESDVKVPAALRLTFGQLFFGYKITPHTSTVPKLEPNEVKDEHTSAFVGSGQILGGGKVTFQSSSKGKEKEKDSDQHYCDDSHHLRTATESQKSRINLPSDQNHEVNVTQIERTTTPDWGVDDDDVIMIDSD